MIHGLHVFLRAYVDNPKINSKAVGFVRRESTIYPNAHPLEVGLHLERVNKQQHQRMDGLGAGKRHRPQSKITTEQF